MDLDLHPSATSHNPPPPPLHHNSQRSPLIRTQNGSADSPDMSDSCQLDQLSLGRLDLSLAAPRPASRAGGGSSCPLSSHSLLAAGTRLSQTGVRINIYHGSQVGVGHEQTHLYTPERFTCVTSLSSGAHELFHTYHSIGSDFMVDRLLHRSAAST